MNQARASSAAARRGRALTLLFFCAAASASCAAVGKEFNAAYGSGFGILASQGERDSARSKVGRLLSSPEATAQDLMEDQLPDLVNSDRLLETLKKIAPDKLRALAEIAGIPPEEQRGPALIERTALGLRRLFARDPEARRPATIAIVEANTSEWSRVAETSPAIATKSGAAEILRHASVLQAPFDPVIRGWTNASARAEGAHHDLHRLRIVAARLQADLLALVEYDWAIEDLGDIGYYLLLTRNQRIRSKVQVSIVDTRTGVILDIFEVYADATPLPPFFRNPTNRAEAVLLEQRRALEAGMWEKLRETLIRELPES